MADSLAIALHRISTLEQQEKNLVAEVAALRERFDDRERERQEEQKRMLVRGIMAMGAVVTALIGIIWNYRSIISRGDLP